IVAEGSVVPVQQARLGFSPGRFWAKNLMFAGALALLAIAIANPRRAERRTPPPQESSDVLIALDVSQSMLARDVSPSRLEQAKQFVQRLAAALDRERLGLVFFAGDAYPQMPLSTDVHALMLYVRNASPDFAADQGTDFGPMLEQAARLLEGDEETGHAVVVISDGEHHEGDVSPIARKAREKGMVIHTVSVGASGGGTIPDGWGGYRRDYQGQVVRTRADAGTLRELAAAGGGVAVSISDADAIPRIAAEVAKLRKTTVELKSYTAYISYFQWLLLPALLLLIGEQVLRWRKALPPAASAPKGNKGKS
ncbi:MAG TPA: VWA domain-containing protein, partial [Saprospiraceae bacterium]|nr:VWA domain-containing protein [Saprospiraceae bacterium]